MEKIRFRLTYGSNDNIVEESDDLDKIWASITEQEGMHGTPFKSGDVLQILKRNDLRNGTYEVYFTIVRGAVG